MFVLIITGCQYDPYADSMTNYKPKLVDITGNYILDQQTLTDNLSDKQRQQAKIIIYPDSTFKAISIPYSLDPVSFKFEAPVSATGKYTTNIIGGINKGSGKIADEWGMVMSGLPESLTYIGFMGDKPPYKLIITFGDPDEGAVMIFKKTSSIGIN